MPKLRKQRRRQKFNHNINRKRLRNKLSNTGKIKCDIIKKEWDSKLCTTANLKRMGLAADLNTNIQNSSLKKELTSKIAATVGKKIKKKKPKKAPPKLHVRDELEKEANAPREKRFQLPLSQVEWVTYLLDKYGSDYKAMARDKKNYYQETWKQIRAKIKVFVGIPEQYNEYLESKGLMGKEAEFTAKLLEPMDCDSDS